MVKKKLNKKAQKVLDTLLEKTKCPHCESNLLESGIGWTSQGEIIYSVGLDGERLTYDEDEVLQNNGSGSFYCKDCGKEINKTDEEVIRLLKQASNCV